MKRISYLLMSGLLILMGCAKEQLPPEKVIRPDVIAGIPPPPLDWENIDFMPTPPGSPTVLAPWASGASRQFTPEMISDYHSADGWMMMYNTFNTTAAPDRWYFILYNKYRGVIRLYYYVPGNANYINSANLNHKLAIVGTGINTSPIMTYAGQDFVDVTAPAKFGSKIEQWQVAPATWYAVQYELAYDQNIALQNYSTLSFSWPIRSTQISNISINGTITGTLTGSITLPGTDFSISPTFNIDGSITKSSIIVNGSSDAEKLKPALGQQIFDNIKSALTNGLQGFAKNILSGIFKKDAPTVPVENVDLRLSANVSLSGTLTSDFLVTSSGFAIPGYDQTGTVGYTPAYNQPLGVFYISNRPMINYTSVVSDPPPDDYYEGQPGWRLYTFSLDHNSFQYIFNPAVLAIADIENLREEIGITGLTELKVAAGYQGFEYVGTMPVYILGDDTGESLIWKAGNLSNWFCLRVSFDVVPKNGAPAVHIVKTFVSNGTLY